MNKRRELFTAFEARKVSKETVDVGKLKKALNIQKEISKKAEADLQKSKIELSQAKGLVIELIGFFDDCVNYGNSANFGSYLKKSIHALATAVQKYRISNKDGNISNEKVTNKALQNLDTENIESIIDRIDSILRYSVNYELHPKGNFVQTNNGLQMIQIPDLDSFGCEKENRYPKKTHTPMIVKSKIVDPNEVLQARTKRNMNSICIDQDDWEKFIDKSNDFVLEQISEASPHKISNINEKFELDASQFIRESPTSLRPPNQSLFKYSFGKLKKRIASQTKRTLRVVKSGSSLLSPRPRPRLRPLALRQLFPLSPSNFAISSPHHPEYLSFGNNV